MRRGGKFFILSFLFILISINSLAIKIGNKEITQNPLDDKYMKVKKGNWYRSTKRSTHEGLDFAAPEGTPVKTVLDGKTKKTKKDPPSGVNERILEIKELLGKIKEMELTPKERKDYEAELNNFRKKYAKDYSIYSSAVDNLGGHGNVVVVEHTINGETRSTTYSHLKEIKTSINDPVKEGDTIGTVGNTGRSDGNHLHFATKDSEGNWDAPYDSWKETDRDNIKGLEEEDIT